MQFCETFTETTIFIHEDKYLSVSKNPESSRLRLKFMFKPAPRCLLFSKMNSRQEIAQSCLSTANFKTKYSSERFLSICGEKKYLKSF